MADRTSSEAGYSLMEMLVVLAIVALILGVAGARMFTILEATRFDQTIKDSVERISTLRARAYLDGQELIITNDPAVLGPRVKRLPLSNGIVMTGEPIRISDIGTCRDGDVYFQSPEGRRRHIRILAPDCRARVVNQAI